MKTGGFQFQSHCAIVVVRHARFMGRRSLLLLNMLAQSALLEQFVWNKETRPADKRHWTRTKCPV